MTYIRRMINYKLFVQWKSKKNLKDMLRTFCYNKAENKITEDNFIDHNIESILYAGHIPSSLFQKILLTIGSSTMALADPYRDDMIAVLGETTGHLALKRIHKKMMDDSEGYCILQEKPRISSQLIDFQYLCKLPSNTLGHTYASFLTSNKISPDTRQPVHFIDDIELAYVMQRYREIHDLIHTILNMPTNMVGEVTVKWIEAIQTGLPMCVAGAFFGSLRFNARQREKYLSKYLPWALQCGFKAKFLMNIYFEQRWEQSMESLYEELNIEKPSFL